MTNSEPINVDQFFDFFRILLKLSDFVFFFLNFLFSPRKKQASQLFVCFFFGKVAREGHCGKFSICLCFEKHLFVRFFFISKNSKSFNNY